MNTVGTCPHCGPGQPNAWLGHQSHHSDGHVSYRCNNCGWDSDRNPRTYSHDEAVKEVIEAARELLKVVHRTDQMFATDAMYRTRAQELRREADRIEERDRRIRRAQHAVARLESLAVGAPA